MQGVNKTMFDNKKLTSLTTRIKKANQSFGVMGSMLLTYEIDAMSNEKLIQLYNHLLTKNVNFTYLTKIKTSKGL